TISAAPATVLQCDVIQHDATVENDLPVADLRQKIALLEQLLESKDKEIQRQDDHID
ncbi:DNA-binding protein, partial [Serratia proteamaculans]